MNNLISVVIPVYNHMNELRESLGTLARQTYKNLEVIVVDDGSTDSFSKSIKTTAAELGLSLKIIEQTNQGAPAARNRGYREAVGEFVIFWDADTIAKPEMLAKLKRELEGTPEASYSYCRFMFGWKTMKSRPFDADELKRVNFIDTTSLVRRSALSDLPGPFDVSLKRFQDWDLWLTLLEQGRTGVFVPEVLFKKVVRGRKGMSAWLPRFLYRLNTSAVKKYTVHKEIVLKKHSLLISSR